MRGWATFGPAARCIVQRRDARPRVRSGLIQLPATFPHNVRLPCVDAGLTAARSAARGDQANTWANLEQDRA
jgi:hypothetical protein